MSNFLNKTNQGRVTKMLEFLDLIEKSAVSNKASEAELQELLTPLLDRLYGPKDNAVEYVQAPQTEEIDVVRSPLPNPGTHAAYNSIREAAEKASLKDLSVSMAIFLDRIGEHLREGKSS